jgi:hypothetical protein
MDKMQTWEASEIMSCYSYFNRYTWDQARSICYIMAQANSTKTLKPSDIIKFKWDEDSEIEERKNEDTKQDMEQLKQLEKRCEKLFADKKIKE